MRSVGGQKRGNSSVPDRSLDLELRATGQTLDGGAQSPLSFLAGKARRHWQWGRSEGWARLIEEDELNPLDRLHRSWASHRWQAVHRRPRGDAKPVYLVGVQRSGTNMVVRGLDRAPEVEVHNENDRRAFQHYRLREDERVRQLTDRSRAKVVLFKPLCDSHRVDGILGATATPGLALWACRSVEGRVRSSLAKFGDHDLTVVRAIARGHGSKLWQAQRLSPANISLLRSFDHPGLTPASASALFWLVRNSLFFELGLHRRSDVGLVSYDRFVVDPATVMMAMCRFIGLEFRPALIAHVGDRAPKVPSELDIEAGVRDACEGLHLQLNAAARRWEGDHGP